MHEPLVLVFDAKTRKLARTLLTDGITGGVIWRLRYLADGSLMGGCGGSNGGILLFWKSGADKDYHRFGLPNILRDMDLHPDGLRVATAHHDGTARITSPCRARKLRRESAVQCRRFAQVRSSRSGGWHQSRRADRSKLVSQLRPPARQLADLLGVLAREIMSLGAVGRQVVELPRSIFACSDELPVAHVGSRDCLRAATRALRA